MSPSLEQYIEAIADLLTEDKVCSVSEIAERVQVSRPAASRAVRELSDKDLVYHKSYGYVDLTEAGQSVADQLTARHESLQAFLRDVLHYTDEEADIEACRLEHHIDDSFSKRLGRLTDFFQEDARLATRWRQALRRGK
jgi:DtxR family transcriptional regulator, Mn-dependent transcriptional regulator